MKFRDLLLIALVGGISFSPLLNANESGMRLGRVFTAPDDRARIDSLRARGVEDDYSLAPTGPRQVDTQARMNGWVQKNGDLAEVWVNGEQLVDRDNPDLGFSLVRGPDGMNEVVIQRQNGSRAELKPGQAWDLGNNEVIDCAACEESPAEPESEALDQVE